MGCQGNPDKCHCTYACERRGNCCACIAFHRPQGQFPACFFTPEAEKSYDRSFARLVADRESR